MLQVRSLLLVAVAVAVMGLVFPSIADTVHMKSGETIEGKIVDEQPGRYLRIKVSRAATWTLYFREIARIERDGEREDAVAKQETAPVRATEKEPKPTYEQAGSEPTSSPVANQPDGNGATAESEKNNDTASSVSSSSTYDLFRRERGPVYDHYPRTSFGIVFGPDFYHEYGVTSQGSSSSDTRSGIVAGMNIEIVASPNFSFQPGLSYVMRGTSSSVESDNLSYITIPLDLKLRFPANQGLSIYFLGGLNFGILTSASSSGFDLSPYMNSFDFGLEFGGGMEFYAGDIVPFVDCVYYLGLTDISNQKYKDLVKQASEELGEEVTVSNIVNRGFELRAGIKFPL